LYIFVEKKYGNLKMVFYLKSRSFSFNTANSGNYTEQVYQIEHVKDVCKQRGLTRIKQSNKYQSILDMKTIKLSFALLFFSSFLSSCIYHCAGFPEELVGWTPYKAGDVIRYQSDLDTIVFEIDSTYKSKPCIFDGPIEEGCQPQYYFSSVIGKLPKISGYCEFSHRVIIDYELTFKKNSSNYYPSVSNNYFVISYDLNKPLRNWGDSKFDTISYQLKNSVIKDVISVENLQHNNPDINKIYIHNGKGLVGFIKNGLEYKLVE